MTSKMLDCGNLAQSSTYTINQIMCGFNLYVVLTYWSLFLHSVILSAIPYTYKLSKA